MAAQAIASNLDALASSKAFAEGYLYAVVLSISLKTSFEMSQMEKYQWAMNLPEAAALSVRRIEKYEAEEKKRIAAAAKKRKKERAARLGIEEEDEKEEKEEEEEEEVMGDMDKEDEGEGVEGGVVDDYKLEMEQAVALEERTAREEARKVAEAADEYESDVDLLEKEVDEKERLLELEEEERARKMEEDQAAAEKAAQQAAEAGFPPLSQSFSE